MYMFPNTNSSVIVHLLFYEHFANSFVMRLLQGLEALLTEDEKDLPEPTVKILVMLRNMLSPLACSLPTVYIRVASQYTTSYIASSEKFFIFLSFSLQMCHLSV